ncbi:MAG: peptidase S16 [Rhodospirillaceae bacterium]|nr:peptidase S16 [Rhodospirillaceae bacterium]
MMQSVFYHKIDDLPKVIPVFPLTGVLLLPIGKLPLNIFEPRYLTMVRDALADEQRIIGMVQPKKPDISDNAGRSITIDKDPALYKTGCAGRISSFTESEDGRYLLTLSGVCRFEIAEEIESKDGYRRIIANFNKFRSDLNPVKTLEIERERLLKVVKQYFELQNIDANWDVIKETSNVQLLTSLAMTCPFGPSERQAILEAESHSLRAEIVITLLEMAIMENGETRGASH